MVSGLAATMTVIAMGLGYAIPVADPTILAANMSEVRIGLGVTPTTASLIACLATLTMAAAVLGAGTLGDLVALAFLLGLSLAIVNAVFAPGRRVAAIALYFGVGYAIAAPLPALGSVLATQIGWRTCFLIAPVIALLALAQGGSTPP